MRIVRMSRTVLIFCIGFVYAASICLVQVHAVSYWFSVFFVVVFGNGSRIRSEVLTTEEIHERYKKAATDQTFQFDLNPVVLIPGLLGSGLESQSTDAQNCGGKFSWSRTWLPLSEVFWGQRCWMSNLALVYDKEKNTYLEPSGVETRPIDFGGVRGVDHLDRVGSFTVPGTAYLASLIDFLHQLGYTTGKSLFAAPYDWRIPPTHIEQQTGYFQRLKDLIEGAYKDNHNRRVNLISHSLGSVMTNQFLRSNLVSPSWRRKYVANFVSLAGAFGGAPESFRAAMSGDSSDFTFLGISLLRQQNVLRMERGAGSFHFLFPHVVPSSLESATFVSLRNRTDGSLSSYSYSEIGNAVRHMKRALNEDASMDALVSSFDSIHSGGASVETLEDPGVPTYCMIGTGVSTEIGYVYDITPRAYVAESKNDAISFLPPEEIKYGDGDGTVPLDALELCGRGWKHASDVLRLPDVDHTGILSSPRAHEVISFLLRETSRRGFVFAHVAQTDSESSSDGHSMSFVSILWASLATVFGVLFVSIIGLLIIRRAREKFSRDRTMYQRGDYVNFANASVILAPTASNTRYFGPGLSFAERRDPHVYSPLLPSGGIEANDDSHAHRLSTNT